MNYSKEEIKTIESHRSLLENNPEAAIDKLLEDLGESEVRVILGICLLLNKPIYLEPQAYPDIDVYIKLGEGFNYSAMLYTLDGTSLGEGEIKSDEIRELFYNDLIEYYHISPKTANKIVKLVRAG